MKQLVCLALLLFACTACLPTPQTVTVTVYFMDENMFAVGTEPYEKAVTRNLPAADDLPLLVLEQLFLGPTAGEQAQGLRLVLSGTTGFSEFRVEDGVAHIRLDGVCNSGGSTYTIANLIFANLAQFPEIEAVKIYDQDGGTEQPLGTSDSIPFCLEP